ncbi:bifunctional 5,10-methylenetetrahydrofolate dehydrogenase/5,10-methenyltetrahydrofolate cyclohydrolase [Candidatus Roizmanbacteria bacterium]|nr:bifunctional 5,10-methylenetetrahydrofolate dehydrogenase/5,10-methenyltetrahydrofolate cyclohydrolase [Candidatus Roizmanbacteria bacterium]
MMIPCNDIRQAFEKHLKLQVQELKQRGITPYLVTILAEDSPEQLSFVEIKRKIAEKIGAKFEFVHFTKPPSFEKFAGILKKYASDPKVTGIIIQQPLPMCLQTDSIYNYISLSKEIEGHKAKSTFLPPLGLAVLTAMKYVYLTSDQHDHEIFDMKKDGIELRKAVKGKNIVIAGRGATGGKFIARALSLLNIPFLNVSSQTPEPEAYYKEADIIITATGKKILSPEYLKPGVVLLNVGLRKQGEKLTGDFDESEIKNIAAFYNKTPGGLGPIDVLYLYQNLIDATCMQNVHTTTSH